MFREAPPPVAPPGRTGTTEAHAALHTTEAHAAQLEGHALPLSCNLALAVESVRKVSHTPQS